MYNGAEVVVDVFLVHSAVLCSSENRYVFRLENILRFKYGGLMVVVIWIFQLRRYQIYPTSQQTD